MPGDPPSRAGWTRTSDLLDLTGKLGEKLRELRETRGISLKEASDLTGVPRPTLSRIEHNKMAPTIGLLSKVVAGYGIPWSSILPDTIISDAPSGKEASFSSLRTQEVKLGRRSFKSLHPNNPLALQLRTFVMTTRHRTVEDGGGYLAHPDTEFCFVLDGTLTIHFKGKRPRRLQAGESALFAASTPHAYRSHTGRLVRFLLVTTRVPAATEMPAVAGAPAAAKVPTPTKRSRPVA
jgi:transcriptional regulator with XRE-family HTH domain